ncbi:MAG: hypothetical protein PVH61_05025 [Candidatus Aminicenantes bacterium]
MNTRIKTNGLTIALIMGLLLMGSMYGEETPQELAVKEAINSLLGQVPYEMTTFKVKFADTVTSENRDDWVNKIVTAYSVPGLNQEAPDILVAGLLTDDASIPIEKIDEYVNLIDSLIDPGDSIVEVQYESPTAGLFTTAAVVNEENRVEFEALLFFTPDPWPLEVKTDEELLTSTAFTHKDDKTGVEIHCASIPNMLMLTSAAAGLSAFSTSCSRKWTVSTISNRIQGKCAEFSITATADCDGGDCNGAISECTGTCGAHNNCALLETTCKISKETIAGNCCRVRVNFAYAYGFKSISVGKDGVTLSVTGILGTGGTWSNTLNVCCSK